MRTFLAVLLVLAGLAVAALWWAGRQAAALPGWYREARAAGTLEPDMEAASRRAQSSLVERFGRELLDELTDDDGTRDESFLDRIKRRGKIVLEGLRDGREVRLTAGDLENLLLAWAADHERGRELLRATRAVHAEVVGGELELGAVIVPAALSAEQLSPARRRLAERLLALAGSDGELYVALRAVPVVAEERLLLGPPMRLRLGGVELGARTLAGLGVDVPELTSGFALDLGRMKVRQAAVDGDSLLLVVSPTL